MKDVATYSGWRMSFGALPPLLFAAIGLGAGLVLLPHIMLEQIRRFHEGYGGLAVCLFPTAIGLVFLSVGARRLRASFEKNCWLRAGRDGVSWRLPGAGRWKTLWIVYDMEERFLAWKDVAAVQLLQHTINGIPSGTDLLIVGKNGGRKTFPRAYFRESAEIIRLTLLDAAKS